MGRFHIAPRVLGWSPADGRQIGNKQLLLPKNPDRAAVRPKSGEQRVRQHPSKEIVRECGDCLMAAEPGIK